MRFQITFWLCLFGIIPPGLPFLGILLNLIFSSCIVLFLSYHLKPAPHFRHHPRPWPQFQTVWLFCQPGIQVKRWTHLWVLPAAACRLHRVRSLDDLLGRGGRLVRGVVWTLLHHVLTLLVLRGGRAGAFTQDRWAGRCALVWITGSAKRHKEKRKKVFHFSLSWSLQVLITKRQSFVVIQLINFCL